MPVRSARPGEDTAVTFGQDQWWKTADGLIHPIDNLTDRHRYNIVWLIHRNAERTYRNWRWWELWWAPLGVGGDYSGDAPPDVEPYEDSEIRAILDREVASNRHLLWLQSTKLYQRLCHDLHELHLPPKAVEVAVPTGCEHGTDGPHDTDEGSYYAPEEEAVEYCPGPVADDA